MYLIIITIIIIIIIIIYSFNFQTDRTQYDYRYSMKGDHELLQESNLTAWQIRRAPIMLISKSTTKIRIHAHQIEDI